ncbi:uncharacterized protein LOC111122280 [Crassostrea virginica]
MDNVSKNTILDFGEDPCKDVEARLKVFKFNYNWADAVEKEEKLRGRPVLPEPWPDHVPHWMRLTVMMPPLSPGRPKRASSMKGTLNTKRSSPEIMWIKRDPAPSHIRILTRREDHDTAHRIS